MRAGPPVRPKDYLSYDRDSPVETRKMTDFSSCRHTEDIKQRQTVGRHRHSPPKWSWGPLVVATRSRTSPQLLGQRPPWSLVLVSGDPEEEPGDQFDANARGFIRALGLTACRHQEASASWSPEQSKGYSFYRVKPHAGGLGAVTKIFHSVQCTGCFARSVYR